MGLSGEDGTAKSRAPKRLRAPARDIDRPGPRRAHDLAPVRHSRSGQYYRPSFISALAPIEQIVADRGRRASGTAHRPSATSVRPWSAIPTHPLKRIAAVFAKGARTGGRTMGAHFLDDSVGIGCNRSRRHLLPPASMSISIRLRRPGRPYVASASEWLTMTAQGSRGLDRQELPSAIGAPAQAYLFLLAADKSCGITGYPNVLRRRQCRIWRMHAQGATASSASSCQSSSWNGRRRRSRREKLKTRSWCWRSTISLFCGLANAEFRRKIRPCKELWL